MKALIAFLLLLTTSFAATSQTVSDGGTLYQAGTLYQSALPDTICIPVDKLRELIQKNEVRKVQEKLIVAYKERTAIQDSMIKAQDVIINNDFNLMLAKDLTIGQLQQQIKKDKTKSFIHKAITFAIAVAAGCLYITK